MIFCRIINICKENTNKKKKEKEKEKKNN